MYFVAALHLVALGCCSRGAASDECSAPVAHLAAVAASTSACKDASRGSLQEALSFLHEQQWLNLNNAQTMTSLRVACESACFAKLGFQLLGEVPEQCNEEVKAFEPASADSAITIFHACRGSFPYSAVASLPVVEQQQPPPPPAFHSVPRPVAKVVNKPVSSPQECAESVALIRAVEKRTPSCHGALRQQVVDALTQLQKHEKWLSLPTKQSARYLEIVCDSFCFANIAPVIEHRVPTPCQQSLAVFSPAIPSAVMMAYHACLKRLPHSQTSRMYVKSFQPTQTVQPSTVVVEREVNSRIVVARQKKDHVRRVALGGSDTLIFLLLALFIGCICLLTLWMHAVHRPGPPPKFDPV